MKKEAAKKRNPPKKYARKRIHILPINDTREHYAQELCWCYPLKRNGIWAHNAKDCREAMERITGEGCSDGWIIVPEIVIENYKGELMEEELRAGNVW